jgi:hypothetical protein
MIAEVLQDEAETGVTKPRVAERLARLAREAETDAAAVDAVRKALEELLA